MGNQQNHDTVQKLMCVISSILKKWKQIILIMLICGIGFDVFRTLTYVPQYASKMTAVLKVEENTYTQLENARAYIKTLDYIFNGQVVNQYVKEKLGVEELNMHCYITSINETNIVNISVVSDSKKNSYFSLKNIVEWYQNNTNQYHFSYELNVLENITLNEVSINTNHHLSNLKYGALVSGLIAVIILGMTAYLKNTIKTPKEIDYLIDCRLFAKIPKENKKRGKKFWKPQKQAILISSLKTSFQYKESIKKLRNRVEESAKKHGYKSIMITSTLENEGKSSIAANLAVSLSENGHTVLLIDADVRKPSIHKIFEIDTNRSLNAYISEGQKWDSQVDYLEKNGLYVMYAHQDLENADKIISSPRMPQLIKKASAVFDFIIVDSSPSYGLNEPLIINEMVDASIIVLKQDCATVPMINDTIRRLVDAKNNLIGCVYNASVSDYIKKKTIYGYRYGYNRYDRKERRS